MERLLPHRDAAARCSHFIRNILADEEPTSDDTTYESERKARRTGKRFRRQFKASMVLVEKAKRAEKKKPPKTKPLNIKPERVRLPQRTESLNVTCSCGVDYARSVQQVQLVYPLSDATVYIALVLLQFLYSTEVVDTL